MNKKARRLDLIFAAVFVAAAVLLIVALFTSEGFLNWAFARHQNRLSWYIRPLFLVPFCLFAWRRSLAGVLGTVLILLTSMFWFPVPDATAPRINDFLAMELGYLTGDWGLWKIALTMLVPLSLAALALAFWKRSLWLGISVLVFIAVAKMIWSVAFGGTSGRAVIAPALIGLAACIVLIFIGFRRLEKRGG